MGNPWFARGWGIAGLVFFALAALYPPLLIFGGLAAVGCFLMGGVLWLREHHQQGSWLRATVARLWRRARGQRTISQSFSIDAVIAGPSFHFAAYAVSESGSQPEMAYVTVHNTAPVEARSCRGRLIAITHVSAPRRQTLDIPLAWAQPDNPSDPARKSFYGSARLNVAVHATPNYMAPAAAHPLDSIDQGRAQFSRDADNLVGVEVSAEGIPAVIGWFLLRWKSFERIRMKDGTEAFYDLRYAHVEFENAPDA